MITAIIFDWHGVLDTESFMHAMESASRTTGKDFRRLYEGLGEEKEACWRGELTPGAFFECVQRVLGVSEADRETIHAAYMPIALYTELWEQLPVLKQQYKLAILSNAPTDKVEVIRKTVDLSVFDHIFFSCEKGKTKMDPSFFMDVAHALGEEPKNCLYIDDQERHVQTALHLGFQTCLFKKINDLLDKIR